ncbi:CDP-6-deoxy-delta-3,4-glucoseen reductase [Kaarinaea lacus]
MSFSVHNRSSGHAFQVEEGESVLDAALKKGYAFPYGCRNGGCGSCKGKLLSGEVDYGTNKPPALRDEDIQNGLALFCQARPCSDLEIDVTEVAAAEDIEIRTMPTKVHKKEFLADDVVRLYLKLPDGERMQFLAGQYVDILLKDGRRRSFSIANAPHDDAYIELHIRHVDGGDFTGYVCDELHEKDILRIDGPHGDFFLREENHRPMIFVAGGTGFAPIKGIIEHILAENLNLPMHLYWGVRDRKDLYLASLAERWAKHIPDFHFVPVFSQPSTDLAKDVRTGYVHEAILEDFPEGFKKYDVYASGPPVMVNAVFDAFSAHGLSEENYFSDAFEYQTLKSAAR